MIPSFPMQGFSSNGVSWRSRNPVGCLTLVNIKPGKGIWYTVYHIESLEMYCRWARAPMCSSANIFVFIDCENDQFRNKWIMIIILNLHSGTKFSGWLRHCQCELDFQMPASSLLRNVHAHGGQINSLRRVTLLILEDVLWKIISELKIVGNNSTKHQHGNTF
jgi:hypothetical protein